MADRWFRLPETGDGTPAAPYRPDTLGHSVDGFSANKNPDGNAPIWYVRVYADEQTLDALAAEGRAQPLDNVPVQAIEMILGHNSSESGVEAGFAIGENRLSYRWQ